MSSRLTLLLLAAGLGCAADTSVGPREPAPEMFSAAVLPVPHMVLAVRAVIDSRGIDSARLVYRREGAVQQVTPYVRVSEGTDTLTALGLRPETSYTFVVEAVGGAVGMRSAELRMVTGALPGILRPIRLHGAGSASPGYTLVVPVFLGGESDGYVLAFDESGEIRWYRAVSGEGWAVEAKQQPNGSISVYVGRSYGWQATAGRYVEFRPDGEALRSFTAAVPFFTDPHDLILTFRDTTLDAIHLLGYDLQAYPPEALGGGRTSLAVHRLLRQSAAGQVEFEWNAGDHFSPTDWPESSTPFDLVHPSSLDIAPDGNYVVSLQAMDAIVKIDARTGAILWRFGGPESDFAIEGDPLSGFQRQHSVRVLPSGNLLFFDNRAGPEPLPSRAVEYRLDLDSGRAELVWEFRPSPPISSPIMGSAQRLGNGNTLVGFGVAARVVEVGPDGTVRWDALLESSEAPGPLQFYRAIRIASLYEYRTP